MAEPYQVVVDAAARRALGQLPEHAQRELVAELRTMAEDPQGCAHLPLQFALSGSMKLKVGAYGAIYTINHGRRLIRVWKIGRRDGLAGRKAPVPDGGRGSRVVNWLAGSVDTRGKRA